MPDLGLHLGQEPLSARQALRGALGIVDSAPGARPAVSYKRPDDHLSHAVVHIVGDPCLGILLDAIGLARGGAAIAAPSRPVPSGRIRARACRWLTLRSRSTLKARTASCRSRILDRDADLPGHRATKSRWLSAKCPARGLASWSRPTSCPLTSKRHAGHGAESFAARTSRRCSGRIIAHIRRQQDLAGVHRQPAQAVTRRSRRASCAPCATEMPRCATRRNAEPVVVEKEHPGLPRRASSAHLLREPPPSSCRIERLAGFQRQGVERRQLLTPTCQAGLSDRHRRCGGTDRPAKAHPRERRAEHAENDDAQHSRPRPAPAHRRDGRSRTA